MSEHQHTAEHAGTHTAPTVPPTPPEKPKLLSETMPPSTVTRNGVPLTLAWYKLLHGAGFEYQAPKVDANNLSDVQSWLGVETQVGILQQFLKKASQLIWKGSFTEEGKFDLEKFIAGMVELSITGAKLSELREQKDELVEQQQDLVQKLSSLEAGTEEFINALKAVKEMGGRIRNLIDTIEKRERKGKDDEKTEPSVPVTVN